jgi:hypothetical protein
MLPAATAIVTQRTQARTYYVSQCQMYYCTLYWRIRVLSVLHSGVTLDARRLAYSDSPIARRHFQQAQPVSLLHAGQHAYRMVVYTSRQANLLMDSAALNLAASPISHLWIPFNAFCDACRYVIAC